MAGGFGLQGQELLHDSPQRVAGEAALVACRRAAVEAPDATLARREQGPVLRAEPKVRRVVGSGCARHGGCRGDRVCRLDDGARFLRAAQQTPQCLVVLADPLRLQRREEGERSCLVAAADSPGES